VTGRRRRPGQRLQQVLVATLLVGALLGCSDDSDPPKALADAAERDAAGLVADGTTDGDPVEGVPEDRVDRLELVLTGVPWSGADSVYIAEGLRTAAAEDPTLLADVVAGAGRSDEDIHPELRGAVGQLLRDDFDAVIAAYGAPVTAGPRLDPEALSAVLSQVGQPEVSQSDELYRGFEQRAIDTIQEDLDADLEGVTAADWDDAMAQAEGDWTVPIGTALGTVLRPACDDDETACQERIEQTQEFVGRYLRGAAYTRIPVSLLPDSLRQPSGERLPQISEDDPAYGDWQRVVDRYPALDLVPAVEAASTGL
jgi:hypothetical protein